MQVNAHSTADRMQLIRTQLNTRQELQFKPKTGVTNSKPVTTYIPPSPDNLPTTRATPAIVTTAPRQIPAPPDFARSAVGQPRPAFKGAVGPDIDLKPTAQFQTNTPVVSDSEPSRPASRIDALVEDWGQSDSPFDYDGNGTVGASDILMLLAKLGGGEPQQRQEPNTPTTQVERLPQTSDQAPIQIPAPPNSLDSKPVTSNQGVAIGLRTTALAQDLIDKLDQDNSGTLAPPEVAGSTSLFDRIDRNHDGAVSRSELASKIRDMLLGNIAKNPNTSLHQFIQDAMNRLSDHSTVGSAARNGNPNVERSAGTYQEANLKATAQLLMQGLTDQGALELRNFVQEGELSASEKRTVLDQISRLRPGAQRVNLVG